MDCRAGFEGGFLGLVGFGCLRVCRRSGFSDFFVFGVLYCGGLITVAFVWFGEVGAWCCAVLWCFGMGFGIP